MRLGSDWKTFTIYFIIFNSAVTSKHLPLSLFNCLTIANASVGCLSVFVLTDLIGDPAITRFRRFRVLIHVYFSACSLTWTWPGIINALTKSVHIASHSSQSRRIQLWDIVRISFQSCPTGWTIAAKCITANNQSKMVLFPPSLYLKIARSLVLSIMVIKHVLGYV